MRLIHCGVGGHGRHWVRNILPKSPDFEVVAIVDVSAAALAEAGEALHVPGDRRFESLAVALDAVEADAILTVTPPMVHLEHARLAFGRGLHVITEKPLADTLANARQMVQMAQASNRQLVVSQDYRYRPTALLVKQLLAEQSLGALGHGHLDLYIPADFTGSFREKMRFPLLVDMCIHHIDLIRSITGRNVASVTAISFRPPWSWYQHDPGLKMLLELEGGIPFSYSGDWSAKGRSTPWEGNWRLQCAHGAILWENEKVVLSRSEKWNKHLTLEYPDVPAVDFESSAATLHSLAEAIRSGTAAPTSGADNLQSLGTVMAAVASAEQHRTIDVQTFIAGG